MDKVHADIEALKQDKSQIKRIQNSFEEINQRLVDFYVFGIDQDNIEKLLNEIHESLDNIIDEAKKFSGDTKARYQTSQQLVPSDLAQQLTLLELKGESVVQIMEEKQREQKRARTIRTDYLSDVDELQMWLRQSELKVKDRSVNPIELKEFSRRIQSEIASMSDKLERTTKNGHTIIENTRDDKEKELIRKTILDLNDQFEQVKSLLDEKKQQIGDSLDAWQRFLTLYESVKAWTEEKRIFLQEPPRINTLIHTRQRLHDYSVCHQSDFIINKIYIRYIGYK